MNRSFRYLCFVFLSVVFLGFSGCIAVTSTDPVNNATGVIRDTLITIRFSVAPDPATINSTNIILKDSHNNTIAGDITLVSNVVTFKPTAILAFLTKYTLTVNKAVKDAQTKQGMIKNYVTSFTTVDSMSWKAPVIISGAGYDASAPQVAMDNKGNAVVAWYQNDGANSRVYKSEYHNGTWSSATAFSIAGKDAYSPRIAVDNNGNAIIVWFQIDGSSTRIFKSEYRGSSWNTPAAISDSATSAYNPMIGMDNNNNAIIVWKQTDPSIMRVYKTEYRSGSWSAIPEAISNPATDASAVQVAMDDNSSAIITWQQSDGANQRIYRTDYR